MLRATTIGAAAAVGLAGLASAQPATPAATPADTTPRVLMQQQESQKTSADLLGLAVFSPQGETVGKISQLVIDQEQRVSAVVLSVGGFLGLGTKSVAVPVEAVQFDTKGGKNLAVVNLTNDELANAPEFKTLAQQKAERDALQIQKDQMNRQPNRTPQ